MLGLKHSYNYILFMGRRHTSPVVQNAYTDMAFISAKIGVEIQGYRKSG